MKPFVTTLLLFLFLPISGQDFTVLSQKEQARVIDEILRDRVENLLPKLMEREGLDMWILISREYNEDPVMKTFLPSTWLSARRRTMMVFYRNEEAGGLDKIAIARYSVGKLLKGQWNVNVYPDQWEALMRVIKDKDPQSIGLNYSQDFALADGLVRTEYETFMEKLPEPYRDRVTSAEKLAIAWLETRSARELEVYPMICHMGHTILQEGLSEQHIHPGITTTGEVEWALRQLVADYGLATWFHPSVSIQRASEGKEDFLRSFSNRPANQIIQMGDLLHVDFGITYLRLNTDQQQHFYVLKPGEKEVPEFLREAFARGNRLQDILTEEFQTGRSGNEILKAALDRAKAEGINATIYTHPIGLHGHAAGPTIGLWDSQGGVKGRGDYPLFPNTAYSIELNAASEIEEWGRVIRIMLEEDGVYGPEGFYYLDGRMENILTIPRQKQ
ncbi:MAG: M24 family metallopeptidase [Bacteroidota bacterium]